MTCFVLWQGRRKTLFRSGDDDATGGGGGGGEVIKWVSRLGVPGRSIVVKCRSRAERDHWVMALSVEMEKLRRGEDVRVEGEEEAAEA